MSEKTTHASTVTKSSQENNLEQKENDGTWFSELRRQTAERQKASKVFDDIIFNYVIEAFKRYNLPWFEQIMMIDKYWDCISDAMNTYDRKHIVKEFRERYTGSCVYDIDRALCSFRKGRPRERMMERTANAYAREHCRKPVAHDYKFVKWCPWFQRMTFVCKLEIVVD